MATRAAAKKPKKSLKPTVVTPSPAALPSVIALSKSTFALLGNNWKLFLGVGFWYLFIGILIGGIAIAGYDVTSVRDEFSSTLLGSLGAYVALVGSGGGVTAQASEVYSTLLFVVASLAIIWALRHAHEQKKVRVKDAYYKGMFPLVPFVLVLVLGLITLLPVTIAAGFYQFVIANGIARAGLEYALWALVVVAGLIATLYLLVVPVIALYVVALPGMTPVVALRSASRLVLGRRWQVIRKMLFMPIILLLVGAVLLVPCILFVPIAAQWVLAAVGVIAIIIAHTYLYELYRSTME